MAKKKNVEKPQRHITKRALSNIKRQKRRQNFIFYGGIFIIAVVIVLVFVGVLGELRPYSHTVVKVYDREFDAQYFLDATKYVSNLYSVDYQQVIQSVPNFIEGSELIRLGAAELGITLSDDEVKEKLLEQEDLVKQEYLAQLEDLKEQGELTEEEYLEAQKDFEGFEIVVNDAVIDLARTDFLNEKLLEEQFKPQVPATADQVNMMAMLLESESEASTITSEFAASGNFTGLAGEYSLDSYTKTEMGDLGWHTREFLELKLGTTVPAEYAFNAEIGTLSQPIFDENLSKQIGYWIINIVERQENTQAYIRVILVGSLEEADQVILRLINGENFEELAREVSQDDNSREQGGDLGWVTPGSRGEAFDAWVFNPEQSEVGVLGPFLDDSVNTTGGYWLVRVVDREEDRPLGEEEIETLAEQAFSDWISQLWEDATDEIDQSFLTAEVTQWIIEKLMEE